MFPSGTHSRGRLTDAEVTFIGFGDGFQVLVDPTNPRFVYDNLQNGRGYVIDLVTREEKRITPVSQNRKERYRFNWNTAIARGLILVGTDAGRHWQLAPGVPKVRVDKIVVHERTHNLLLGTHGRSAIILDDITPLDHGAMPGTTRPKQQGPQLFPIRPAMQVYQWRDLPALGD